MCFLRHARGSGWLVPKMYREATTPPRPQHADRIPRNADVPVGISVRKKKGPCDTRWPFCKHSRDGRATFFTQPPAN